MKVGEVSQEPARRNGVFGRIAGLAPPATDTDQLEVGDMGKGALAGAIAAVAALAFLAASAMPSGTPDYSTEDAFRAYLDSIQRVDVGQVAEKLLSIPGDDSTSVSASLSPDATHVSVCVFNLRSLGQELLLFSLEERATVATLKPWEQAGLVVTPAGTGIWAPDSKCLYIGARCKDIDYEDWLEYDVAQRRLTQEGQVTLARLLQPELREGYHAGLGGPTPPFWSETGKRHADETTARLAGDGKPWRYPERLGEPGLSFMLHDRLRYDLVIERQVTCSNSVPRRFYRGHVFHDGRYLLEMRFPAPSTPPLVLLTYEGGNLVAYGDLWYSLGRIPWKTDFGCQVAEASWCMDTRRTLVMTRGAGRHELYLLTAARGDSTAPTPEPALETPEVLTPGSGRSGVVSQPRIAPLSAPGHGSVPPIPWPLFVLGVGVGVALGASAAWLLLRHRPS